MKTLPSQVEAYTALSEVYDEVMGHVDYRAWAIYLSEIVEQYYPQASSLLEAGCGTGSLALELRDFLNLKYVGFDRSAHMIDVARQKAAYPDMSFHVHDFKTFTLGPTFDVVFLLYDGLNYLLDPEDIKSFFSNVRRTMHSESLFVFDTSTPANSLKNSDYFEDSGKGDDFSYYRSSGYDVDARLHRTEFQLEIRGEKFEEVHLQRAYTADEVNGLLSTSGLRCERMLHDFSWTDATEKSERIHFIARRDDFHDSGVKEE